MQNKENLNNMARRYKDEMMKLYRSTSPGQNTVRQGAGASVGMTPVCNGDKCKFMPPEDILSDIPTTLPSFGGTPVLSPEEAAAIQTPSLASSGAVNFDYNTEGQNMENGQNMNSAGQRIYVPYADNNLSSDSFGGIYINPLPDSSQTSDNTGQSSMTTEILPDFELPPDLDEDTDLSNSSRMGGFLGGYIISPIWQNLTGDNGWGYLQFEVTTGSLGNPVQNATVVVSRYVRGRLVLSRILKTGLNGLTRIAVLPAPRYYYNPFRPNQGRPFAEYRASVYANNYYPVYNISLMIYCGVKSVQPVDMVPVPQYPNPGIQPRS